MLGPLEVRDGAGSPREVSGMRLRALLELPELVAELEGLLAASPTRETLVALLMRALAADGRRGTALQVYERTRERLADQLGADPSPQLAALHMSLLRADGRHVPLPPRPSATPAPSATSRDALVSRPIRTRFSVPLSVSSSDAYWPVSPMSWRTWCA
jgi:hypothetical protein